MRVRETGIQFHGALVRGSGLLNPGQCGLSIGKLEMRGARSSQIDSEFLEFGERTVFEGTFMGGPQDHARRLLCIKCFLPARRTKAPAVTEFQSGEAKFRDG